METNTVRQKISKDCSVGGVPKHVEYAMRVSPSADAKAPSEEDMGLVMSLAQKTGVRIGCFDDVGRKLMPESCCGMNGEVTEGGYSRSRSAVVLLAEMVRSGSHRKAMKKAGFDWVRWNTLMLASPALSKVYYEAKGMMRQVIGEKTLDAASERAIEGSVVPIKGKSGKDTVIIGHTRKFSDKLAEKLLYYADRGLADPRGAAAASGAGGDQGVKISYKITINNNGLSGSKPKSLQSGVVDV